MLPNTIKYTFDIITLILGFYIGIQVFRSAIGGTVGTAFKLILVGIFVLAINHFLDTSYFSHVLKAHGHIDDIYQAPIVHRVINLVGFVFMTLGFQSLTKTPK